ncbi:MAG: helix-turn-helix domain-containing protein [Acidobacteriaceae bacterium]|jgi:transcriptional regulator with XRE-family HTH domain|nr:helix-turn-helix domain-containing protein [Acidobacteriaceae bacterium]
MSDESIGCRLRAERERRRITLESISEHTKISLGLLTALERNDVSRWPGGIFRRSFVRAYAEAIGVNPDETVQAFLTQHPEPEQGITLPGLPPTAMLAAVPAIKKGSDTRKGADTVLRLTLDEAPHSFSAGELLQGMRSRLSAVACDLGATFAFALTAYVFFQSFWAPLGVFMLCYYLGSVLVLGNTPGVCLFAPGTPVRRPVPPPAAEEPEALDVPTNAVPTSAISQNLF